MAVIKTNLIRMILVCVALTLTCSGATHYVVPCNTGNASPYTNWATAATNIQDAVNVARTSSAPRVVWVSNGVYCLTNQITVDSAVTVASVNGRELTIVDGNYPNVTNRCFNVSTNSVLDGFTVRNGCVLTVGGAGVYAIAGAKIQNCRIISNMTYSTWAGGIRMTEGGTISNCEILGNIKLAGTGAGGGAGIYLEYSGSGVATSLIVNCIIASNTIGSITSSDIYYGGGICLFNTSNTLVDKCVIYGNSCLGSGGSYGGGMYLKSGAIRDTLIYSNFVGANSKGGGIYMPSYGSVQDCTIVSNSAGQAGGGVYCTSYYPGTTSFENVICYLNTSASGSNFTFSPPSSSATGFVYIVNSCIVPTSAFPSSAGGYYYANNIESNPQFVNKDGNDFRLVLGSPCVNAGTNEDWMAGALDLDGRSRIDRFSGVVDMGCYEYLPRGVMLSIP